MSQTKLVGIAEMVISDCPDDILAAPNLGSCLGIAIYDRPHKLGGMIHCLLPLSQSDPEKAKNNPCTYVDTGVAHLLNLLLRKGSRKMDLEIYVAGGAAINDERNYFQIGKKNMTVFRKILWKNNLLIKGEHVGGDVSRTISININSGEVLLKIAGNVFPLGK